MSKRVTTGPYDREFGRTSTDEKPTMICGNVLVSARRTLLHTEEVTGSIPVSPTSANAPSRSWEGAFDYNFDNNAGTCAHPSATSY